jgi:hypothetical protein
MAFTTAMITLPMVRMMDWNWRLLEMEHGRGWRREIDGDGGERRIGEENVRKIRRHPLLRLGLTCVGCFWSML